jgi:hypothetical protein
MTELKAWLTQLKTEKPELNNFITKLEPFFSEVGFDASKFEKAINLGLKKIETDISASFNPNKDA